MAYNLKVYRKAGGLKALFWVRILPKLKHED